jgi:pimeloyl-ACP methyl ester carboxylesterase
LDQFVYVILGRLSFALAAGKLKQKVRVVAMDLRGHGNSQTDDETDISIEAGDIYYFF